MQKVIGDEVKTLTRVSADTAIPLFEPERAPAITDNSIDDLLAGVDEMVSGLQKKDRKKPVIVPGIDRDSLFNEINEVAHRYDDSGSIPAKQAEKVQVRTLNIF